MNKTVLHSLIALFALALTPSTAHAYLDAGTGSMILQALAAGVAGAVVIGRMYWHRFMVLIGKRPNVSTSDAADEVAEENER